MNSRIIFRATHDNIFKKSRRDRDRDKIFETRSRSRRSNLFRDEIKTLKFSSRLGLAEHWYNITNMAY